MTQTELRRRLQFLTRTWERHQAEHPSLERWDFPSTPPRDQACSECDEYLARITALEEQIR